MRIFDRRFDALWREGFQMTKRSLASLGAAAALIAFVASPAFAQSSVKVGTLTCDVSAGIGLLISQQQVMTCSFDPAAGGPPDSYTGRIEKFGLALGAVQQGTMVWGVLAPSTGFPHGALAGTYGGVGAAPFRPRSDWAQFRCRGDDADAHFGTLTSSSYPPCVRALTTCAGDLCWNGSAVSVLVTMMEGKQGAGP
jgi:Protein of unknown function (DUF992)